MDYQATHDLLLYGKVARGFKAGGFNYSAPRPSTLTYKPEYVTNYEEGVKSEFRLGTVPVRLNVTGFSADYKNIQRTISDAAGTGCTGTNTPLPRCTASSLFDQGSGVFNAQKARIRGLELETSLKPTRYLTISGSYSHLDAKYKTYLFPFSPTSPAFQTKIGCDGTVVKPALGTTALVDLSCAPLPYTPKNLYTVGTEITIPVSADRGDIVINTSYSHVDAQYNSPGGVKVEEPFAGIPGYHVVNVSLEWQRPLGSELNVRVFATNLFNKTYVVTSSSNYAANIGSVTRTYGEPRMYGLALRWMFGH